jgi:hypothetical protein
MYDHVQRAHHFLKPFGELHAVAVCFNPMRYVSRYTLFKEFIPRAVAAGAKVHVVEAAFGDRPAEIGDLGQASHTLLRTSHELWLKESMINAAVARLPDGWKYVAWVDADVAFSNPHWVQETIHQLQHYSVVQMWHTAIDLDPGGAGRQFRSFAASAIEEPGTNSDWQRLARIKMALAMGKKPASSDLQSGAGYYGQGNDRKAGSAFLPTIYWHPGFAWACTREAWDTMGGLLDINIVGGGDHQMANGFFGMAEAGLPLDVTTTEGYRNAVLTWQEHARGLKQNVGFVPGILLHHFHGKKTLRGYTSRWKILADSKFDPRTDLRRDWQGLWQLAGNKPNLRDDLRAYFRERCEDSY